MKKFFISAFFASKTKSGVSFKDILDAQRDGAREAASSGLIGLHLVSGPLVGFAIGYGLDRWLHTSPWLKLIFLFIGICAGFLNVWRDTKILLQKIDAQQKSKSERKSQERDQ